MYPNWVTCAWPPDYPEILEWQWEKVLIPYWRESVQFAATMVYRRSDLRCIRDLPSTTRRRCFGCGTP